jgi:hypothetical protein
MYPIAKRLTDDAIEAAIRAAVSPYKCGIDMQADHGAKLKFVVRLPDGTKVPYNADEQSSKPDTAGSLNKILHETRQRIKAKGYTVDEWDDLPKETYTL